MLLSVIGGKSEVDVIKNIMAEVIGPRLSKKYNWHGKKHKLAFKKLQLSKVVFGESYYYTYYTNDLLFHYLGYVMFDKFVVIVFAEINVVVNFRGCQYSVG
jgi:hypothetical protein